MATALKASTFRAAAVRVPVARRQVRVRAAFRKSATPKRNLKTQPQKGSATADPRLMTSDRNRDIITHTIWGEHDFAVFFLLFACLPFVPIFAPGFVWIARAMTGY